MSQGFPNPPPNPYGAAPDPYGANPYSPGLGMTPPPRRDSALWWFLGCGGFLFLLVCCGSCGGITFWGIQITEEEIAAELRDNPKLVEQVGEVQSFTHDWSQFLSDDSDSDHDVFAVKGTKGSGKVIVEHSSGFGETEEIHSAVLVLPSGARIDLLAEPTAPLAEAPAPEPSP